MEYKTLLGYLAVAIELISYAIYFWGILKGKTKPHAFTWFVWSVISIIGFFAVYVSGAGAGSWILGVNAVLSLIIAFIGFRQKHVIYDKYDWTALFGSLAGALLWWLTDNPLYAVILVAISDVVALVPTVRKAYKLPFEEHPFSFSIGAISYPISILALSTLSFTTWFYPAIVALADATLAILILVRRKKLRKLT
jgi:hypothetical protein